MYYYMSLVIIVSLVVKVSETNDSDKCKRLLLIQPLIPSLTGGLEYVVFGGGNYYLITNRHLSDNSIPIESKTGPDHRFEEPTAVMVYFNDKCSPPLYYLLVNKMIEKESYVYNWHSTLNLHNWSIANDWSKAVRKSPEFFAKDPYANVMDVGFTMLWPKQRNLYIIQFPVSGSQDYGRDYHSVLISDDCSKDQYFADEMKFKKILHPYEDYDSCFIPDDKHIICYGSQGFRSYDIDLDKTEEGNIRVKNTTKDFTRIPIMDRIEEISKRTNTICEEKYFSFTHSEITSVGSNQSVTNSTEGLLTVTTNNIFNDSEITEITDQSFSETTTYNIWQNNVTEVTEDTEEPNKEGPSFWFWFILVLLIISVILFVIIFFLCSNKKVSEQNNDSKSNKNTQLDQKSSVSMRSGIQDSNKVTKSSTIDAHPSLRSKTDSEKGVPKSEKTPEMDQMSTASMRSGTIENNNTNVPQSTIEANPSMRSKMSDNQEKATEETDKSMGQTDISDNSDKK